MTQQIGAAAGKVWHFLSENGPSTVSQIQRGTGVDAALTNQALGWLAREGKLVIDRSKRFARFSVTE